MLTFREYEPIPALDVYEGEGIDDEGEDNELTMEARLSAEREMSRRDRMMGISQGRMRHGLLYGKSHKRFCCTVKYRNERYTHSVILPVRLTY